MIRSAGQKNVRLKNGLFRERAENNRKYLKELDSTCLLQNFYLEAGIILPGMQVINDPAKAKLHWGWESPACQLRGHFLGHWLSAAAHYIASDGDPELKVKLDHIISELARCQQLNGGEWVGSIPEKYFEILTTDRYIWSPQYTMHKIIMGLYDSYIYADSTQALGIVDKLADWYVKWTEKLTAENKVYTVYKGEQAGMLEMWAKLYSLTGKEKYRTLISFYKENALYSNLVKNGEGHDVFTDNHANASIPLFHGAAAMYELTGDGYWRTLIEKFWEFAVEQRGMYATTGQNAGEFWIPNGQLAQYIGDNDQEFCTVYNLVRMADHLYRLTGDTVYADYIEKCLYNGFLAQNNRTDGMTAYFLPLGAGSRKKWSSRTNDFWCCCGTMVQAQAMYPEIIYYTDENRLIVSQYIQSEAEVTIGGKKVSAALFSEMKNYDNQTFFDEQGSGGEKSRWSFRLDISCEEPAEFTVSLRVPEWCGGAFTAVTDGQPCDIPAVNGYIDIRRTWKNSSVFILMKSSISAEPLHDCPDMFAFKEGPVVLAGLTAKDRGICGTPEEILFPRTEHTYGTFVWKPSCYVTKEQPENFELRPLYDITDEEYTVYFTRRSGTE